MNTLQTQIKAYLEYCKSQKRLDEKTLKAYSIDLKQFAEQYYVLKVSEITGEILEKYIKELHLNYKPKTVKRKIASLKAFFHHLEFKDIIDKNPFRKVQVRFREPQKLPKTIPLNIVELFLSTIYKQISQAKTQYQKRNALRDVAIIELLFATGIRISELCTLSYNDINLSDGSILIYGKGAKERLLQIGSIEVLNILIDYKTEFEHEINSCKSFFVYQKGTPISDQSIRRMINKYTQLAAINLHITPHMFRHTFATSLLEAGVDIRFIQEMLGHSSINVTEIYTHVTTAKQRDILNSKHPRKNFHI